jgi:hypothetical protein
MLSLLIRSIHQALAGAADASSVDYLPRITHYPY